MGNAFIQLKQEKTRDDDMNIALFFKSLLLSAAIVLVSFALWGSDLMFLAKGMALAIGASIVVAIAYPQLRGVRKGDRVSLVRQNMLTLPGFGKTGFALNHSSMHKEVRVKMDDGREAVGVVESYESLLSPPRVRIMYEEQERIG